MTTNHSDDTTGSDLVPARRDHHLSSLGNQFPEILSRAGPAAIFAAEEFFFGRIRNAHTRSAYRIAVRRFLVWAEAQGLELVGIAPKDVGQYLDGLRNENTSIATRKQHLAALRHFFDGLVMRHGILLNPALSVRGERYQVVESKTPEITVKDARTLLASMDTSRVVGLRDRAIVAILIYTASRAGAVAALKRGSFYHAGDQWMLHFEEKGGKSREIPVRQDLQEMIFEYLDAAGLRNARKDAPLFRTAYKKTGQLTKKRLVRRGHLPHGEAAPRRRGLARRVVPPLVPRHHHHGPPRTGCSPRRRAAPRRSCRPPHHPALRPAAEKN